MRYHLPVMQKQDQEIKQLIKIERRLIEIKNRTSNTKIAFIYGLLQGAGAVVGSIAAITLVGWVLSGLGVIPGFTDIANYFRDLIGNWRGGRY